MMTELTSQRGQAMVEVAAALPVVLIILLGAAYFGVAFGDQGQEARLVNLAARYAAANSCPPCLSSVPPTVNQYTNDQAQSDLSGNITVQFAFADANKKFPGDTGYSSPKTRNHCMGEPVRVRITYPYSAGLLPTKTIGEVAVFRIEKDWKGDTSDAYTAVGASADAC